MSEETKNRRRRRARWVANILLVAGPAMAFAHVDSLVPSGCVRPGAIWPQLLRPDQGAVVWPVIAAAIGAALVSSRGTPRSDSPLVRGGVLVAPFLALTYLVIGVSTVDLGYVDCQWGIPVVVVAIAVLAGIAVILPWIAVALVVWLGLTDPDLLGVAVGAAAPVTSVVITASLARNTLRRRPLISADTRAVAGWSLVVIVSLAIALLTQGPAG